MFYYSHNTTYVHDYRQEVYADVCNSMLPLSGCTMCLHDRLGLEAVIIVVVHSYVSGHRPCVIILPLS